MTVLTNKEYAELVIKAHKYDEMDKPEYKELVEKATKYDKLREQTLRCSYISSSDKELFGITDEEIEAYRRKENK